MQIQRIKATNFKTYLTQMPVPTAILYPVHKK